MASYPSPSESDFVRIVRRKERMASTRPVFSPLNLLLATATGAACLILAILFFGHVSGEEFSPRRFSRREFGYYRIPLLKWQVWPIRYRTRSDDLTSFLRAQRWIGNPNDTDSRWDVVFMTAGKNSFGDASLLTTYLDQYDAERKLVWLEWSRSHPALAGQLWPTISQLARAGAYLTIPRLMEIASNAREATELRQEIRDYLAAHLVTIAEAARQAQDYQLLSNYCDAALALDLDVAQFSDWKHEASRHLSPGSTGTP